MRGPGRLPLRLRVTLAFGLACGILTGILAIATFHLATAYMLNQREQSAVRQAQVNARLVESSLRRDRNGLHALLTGLGSDVESAVLVIDGGRWTSSGNLVDPARLPKPLEQMVGSGQAARERVVLNGVPVLAVGIPMSSVGASYFEAFPLRELDRAFRYIGWMLAGAVLIASIAGAAIGRWVSSRALRPLVGINSAAAAVAKGDLSVRLPDSADPDLHALSAAFNDTTAQLEERVRSDARFASDVSHELRSPLTTILNALAVLRRRQSEMSENSIRALDLLDDELNRFHRLVTDLLEISRDREDGGAFNAEHLDLGELVRRICSRQGVSPDLVHTDTSGPQVVGDRRLIERVVVNLLVNAKSHAGGVTAVSVRRVGDLARVQVDDSGPGVRVEDRSRIFERFARARPSAREDAEGGTGLGLAIVQDHVRRHDGRTWVEDAPTGGARFVVELAVSR